MPSGGLARTYFSAMLSPDLEYMLCGTSVGDMLVFNLKNSVYRASVPVCSSGLVSIAVSEETGEVFCGGGDGTLKKLMGKDMRWELHGETMLDGKIVSLSMMAGGTELLAAAFSASAALHAMLAEVNRICGVPRHWRRVSREQSSQERTAAGIVHRAPSALSRRDLDKASL